MTDINLENTVWPYDSLTYITKRDKHASQEDTEIERDAYVWNGSAYEITTPFLPIVVIDR